MEAVELAITGSLKKYEAENSNVVEDLKSIWSGFQKVKEVYQKCRKDKLNKGSTSIYLLKICVYYTYTCHCFITVI